MRLYLSKAEAEHLRRLLDYGLKVDDNSPQMDAKLIERIDACEELQGKHPPDEG